MPFCCYRFSFVRVFTLSYAFHYFCTSSIRSKPAYLPCRVDTTVYLLVELDHVSIATIFTQSMPNTSFLDTQCLWSASHDTTIDCETKINRYMAVNIHPSQINRTFSTFAFICHYS